MSVRANALASYGKIANAETNTLQQIVMLYEGAIKFLRLAASDIESGDLVAKATHTNRVLDILVYLQSTLNFEQAKDVAHTLDELYRNVVAITLRASAQLDSAGMLRAANLLMPVRDAWAINANNGSAITSEIASTAPQPPPLAEAAPSKQFQASF